MFSTRIYSINSIEMITEREREYPKVDELFKHRTRKKSI